MTPKLTHYNIINITWIKKGFLLRIQLLKYMSNETLILTCMLWLHKIN